MSRNLEGQTSSQFSLVSSFSVQKLLSGAIITQSRLSTSITFIYQKIINLRSAIGDSINLKSKIESKIINLTSSIKDSISGYSKERM